jgi:hypothetical protein
MARHYVRALSWMTPAGLAREALSALHYVLYRAVRRPERPLRAEDAGA